MSLQEPWADKKFWVFDLDNTLYPAECDLFAQIDRRMTDYVSRFLAIDLTAARTLQKRYLVEHGTTLNGMMKMHAAAPGPFLDFVHDIDLSPITPDPVLARRVAALPGKKLVFTNGSRAHGERVVARLGLSGLFDDIFDIAASAYAPKPDARSYQRLIDRHGVQPLSAALFEDLPRNLAPAAALGFTTVLVRSTKDWSHEPEAVRPGGAGLGEAFIHHATDDLPAFLGAILGE